MEQKLYLDMSNLKSICAAYSRRPILERALSNYNSKLTCRRKSCSKFDLTELISMKAITFTMMTVFNFTIRVQTVM